MKAKHLILVFLVIILSQIVIGTTDAVAGSTTWKKTMTAVKQELGGTWVTVPDHADALRSISVTSPYAGYVIVTATGTVSFTHTAGTQGFFCLDLSDTENYTGGCIPMAGSATALRSWVPASFPSTGETGFGIPYSIVEVFPVTAGATETFYLNGYATGFDNCSLFQSSLTALFVPVLIP